VLYVQRGLDAPPVIFLDPNTLSQDGTVALSGAYASRDGALMACAVSRSGSDWQEIFLMDVESRETLADRLTGVKFSGASWHGNGFYYSRYADSPEAASFAGVNERQKIFYHAVGTPQSRDRLIYEDPEHPRRMSGIGITEDERYLVLSVSEQGSNGNALYVRKAADGGAPFTPLVESFEDDFGVVDNEGDLLIVHSNRGAPRGRVVLIDPSSPEESRWKTVLPEKKDVLVSVNAVGGKLIAVYMRDASHQVYQYDRQGRLEREIVLPALCTVSGFDGKKEDTYTFFNVTSFTFAGAVYKYDILSGKVTPYWSPSIPAELDAFETKQVFYKSKDGTRVPMFLVHKKGLRLDGGNPVLLYGYGGFNVSMTPAYSPSRVAWLENGGVLAVACLRGGNEYGEDWHKAGTRLNKQTVFDDFIAAAEYLIARKYTNPRRLVAQGGSNGGLLVGAVINQRPDLFAVALPAVGVMDMLRFHKFTIGWAWVNDYGSSDDPDQFRYLLKYSPLHNIRGDVHYPAVLVTTADHDDRVVPLHSFKYMATLQEKHRGPKPTLIRIDVRAGHGAGKPTGKLIEEAADVYSFAMFHTGMKPR